MSAWIVTFASAVPPLVPEGPIQRPVLDRLRDVLICDLLNAVQVRQRAANFQNAVLRAGRKTEFHDRAFEPRSGCRIEVTVPAD